MSTEEAFIIHYLICAEWAENDPDTEEPLDNEDREWTPEALYQSAFDCLDFLANAPGGVPEYGSRQYTDAQLAGHDFWLTRNRHGAGFWDRGLGSLGDTLSDYVNKRYSPVTLYVIDNELIDIL